MNFRKSDFGEDFHWGISSSAFQTEGTTPYDGRGSSIWDEFSKRRGKIARRHNASQSSLFYKYFRQDISYIEWMNLENFRFSISWSRIFPEGVGKINERGVDFYNRLIDFCLENNIKPWLTLYHWDLPNELQKRGGWKNRDIIHWFNEYVFFCAKKFGDRVNDWMVLNEPTAFTALGYYLGVHAPGKKGLKNFLPAMHHAAIAQSAGAKVLKNYSSEFSVGTTFSFTSVEPLNKTNERDLLAAEKVDALLNRLFLEPILGIGYPEEYLSFFDKMGGLIKSNDFELMQHDFDFIGVQNYSREVVSHSYFTPIVNAKLISPKKRNKPYTEMHWEVYPKSIYKVLKRLSKYPNIPKLIITENGAAFKDEIDECGKVNDIQRIKFIQENLRMVLKAKNEGVDVQGYFVWSLTDNFEWAEGYRPRFGLIYVDYDKQKRIPKNSAFWYKEFLK